MDGKGLGEFASEEVLKATLSAIDPTIGAFGAALIDARRSGLFGGWLHFVDADLRDHGIALDPSEPADVAMFNRVTLAALQTSRTEKWVLLAAVLRQSGRRSPSPDYVVEHFADLVVRFSPEHVRVMAIVDDLPAHSLDLGDLDAPKIVEAVAKDASDLDRADLELVVDAVWSDLVANGIVDGGYVSAFNRTVGTDDVEDAIRTAQSGLTVKGKRFLAYLQG